MQDTYVTTFGFNHRDPGAIKGVDRVYDVRDLPDFPFDTGGYLEKKAHEIMDELEPGDHVAIGCEHGHDRSPYIAKLIEDNFPGVSVEHLDYGKSMEKKGHDHASDEGENAGHHQREHSRDEA